MIFTIIKILKEIKIYVPETAMISSIKKPISINSPNNAVPNAVANTIRAVVNALIDPRCFTPYISAQVDDPNIFAKPFEIPTKPKNTKAVIGVSKKNKTIVENKSGIFI